MLRDPPPFSVPPPPPWGRARGPGNKRCLPGHGAPPSAAGVATGNTVMLVLQETGEFVASDDVGPSGIPN